MSTIGTISDSHAETTRLDIHEVARRLNSHLGPTLVAVLANVKDPKLPHKWAKADGSVPRAESYRRLLAAHRVWSDISNAESDSVARSWFIGANPRLGEASPVMALREGMEKEVLAAAKAFVEGTDD
jgi:hypothetical protein